MYGGLFGDLPSAKKQKKTSADGTGTSSNNNTIAPEDKNSESNGNSEDQNDAKKSASGSSKAAMMFAPGQAPRANKKQSHFLQTLGKSGTIMAFVPTAAMKPKRKKAPVANNTTTSSNADTNKCSKTTSTNSITRISASKTTDSANPTIVVDIHGTFGGVGTAVDSTTHNNNNASKSGEWTAKTLSGGLSVHEEYNELDSEQIADPYDPYVPNDLLEYWEALAAKKHREKLEQDNRATLERQQAMRQRLDYDPRALRNQDNPGIPLETAGKGRGRGVSNLPAWWLEQQRREQGDGVTGSSSNMPPGAPAPSSRGRGRGVSNLPAWLVEKQRREAASSGQ